MPSHISNFHYVSRMKHICWESFGKTSGITELLASGFSLERMHFAANFLGENTKLHPSATLMAFPGNLTEPTPFHIFAGDNDMLASTIPKLAVMQRRLNKHQLTNIK